MNDNKKKKNSYRLDIVLIVSFFVMLISFCAYMMNTTLEEVLENETGSSVVTHDYTYEQFSSIVQNSKARQVKVLYSLTEFAYLRHFRGMERHLKMHKTTS